MLDIIWSLDAVEDFLENIDYLEKRWTKKVIERFSAEIDTVFFFAHNY